MKESSYWITADDQSKEKTLHNLGMWEKMSFMIFESAQKQREYILAPPSRII